MAGHRAPSAVIPGEQHLSARVVTIIGFSVGWAIWMWGMASHGVATTEDLSTYPAGIALLVGIYRSLEGVFTPVTPAKESP